MLQITPADATHQLFTTWLFMVRAVYDKTHRTFQQIGARGIGLCHDWHTFDAFVEDMGPRPSAGSRLYRKDITQDFTPDNCEWRSSAWHEGRNPRKASTYRRAYKQAVQRSTEDSPLRELFAERAMREAGME